MCVGDYKGSDLFLEASSEPQSLAHSKFLVGEGHSNCSAFGAEAGLATGIIKPRFLSWGDKTE